MIEFLALPALVCTALVAIHAYFGLHVLRRNVIFVDLALAQVAALGATLAFALGHAPQTLASYLYSLAATLAAAALLASTRGWSSRISQEAQIGVIYVVAAAALSFALDLTTGATLVCAVGAALALAALARLGSRLWKVARIAAAAALALSGLWIGAFPRADQPLLDAAEHFAPRLRAAYMD